ncbi:Oidioi.mRNA.OKI2018_I69.PAR.g11780.t3.cds [Oikopleura dioica]|uniref:Oidioi.mRNA.OKI2018_I69.PAR.g11780.t3.cds n=1 Tax=Oikopleura dioica TaxID=34765 RepID=A0ABN7RX94_OIKDI|nr:Oidioi.mRNA.OKI2018_I69.PAR.g11780.t3.cds [Oikopleura dioica]
MDLDWFVKEVTELSERLQIAVDKLPQKDEKSKDRKFVPVLHRGQEEKPALESETYSLEEHQSILYKSLNGSAEVTPDKESLKSTRAKWTQSSSPVIIAKDTQDVKQPNTAFEIPITPPAKTKPKPNLRATSARQKRDRIRSISPSSDGIEQDENRPPDQLKGAAFEIPLSPTKDKKTLSSKQRDTFAMKQLEREQEIRKKRFQREEQKRLEVRRRAAEDELKNESKQHESERRKIILENHKAKKGIPSPTSKSPSINKRYGSAVNLSESPSRMSRSKSTTLYDGRSTTNWDTMSCVSQITTTRVFKEPTTKSNKQLMEMALKFHALPGPVNKNERLKALDSMNNSGANHYMALYKEKAYRGLYEVHQVDELMRISKIHGTGPKEVTETMISELLKFNSGAKNFQLVDGKTLSPAIDGFRLNPNCWLSKRPLTPSIGWSLPRGVDLGQLFSDLISLAPFIGRFQCS